MADVEFDHHSPGYAGAWREINADLRKRCPVARTDAHGGFWVVSRYEDVAAVALDDELFSSYQVLPDGSKAGVTIPASLGRQIPIEMDPPEFFAYRRLLNTHFSPATAKRWQPFLRDVTTFCINRISETGAGDLVLDVAAPVPAIFTMRLLGLPLDNWEFYAEAAHKAIYTAPGTSDRERADAGIMQMMGELIATITARRKDPGDDLISLLTRAELDGEELSDERVLDMATLIIFGGVDTTTSLVASTLEWLFRHPRERARLRDDPDLLPHATEEFLRYFTPTQLLSRTVTRDCTLGGQSLRAGDRVLISWASANYDETVFDRPDEVLLDRFPNRHQSFGLGIHRCLGSNFARSEFSIIVGEVLRRIPDYVIDTAAARRYPSVGVVNGWISLPATFTPTPAEGSDFSLSSE